MKTDLDASSSQPPDEASNELGSFRDVTGERVVAAVIDLFLMTMLLIAMSVVFGSVGFGYGHTAVFFADGFLNYYSGDFTVEWDNSAGYVYLFLYFSYHAVTEGLMGATIGKRILGLRVIKIDRRPCGWTRVLVRNIFRAIDGLPIFYLLGFIVMNMTPKAQRLGDLFAGTIVVAKADLGDRLDNQPVEVSKDADSRNAADSKFAVQDHRFHIMIFFVGLVIVGVYTASSLSVDLIAAQ